VFASPAIRLRRRAWRRVGTRRAPLFRNRSGPGRFPGTATPPVRDPACRGPAAAENRLAGMDMKPVNLTEALASFDDSYSPRIVAG